MATSSASRSAWTAVITDVIPWNYQELFSFADSIRSPQIVEGARAHDSPRLRCGEGGESPPSLGR